MRKIKIDRHQNHPDGPFPIVYELNDQDKTSALEDLVGRNKQKIAAELNVSGAVVFRGLGIETDQEFDRFIRAFSWPSFTYNESLSNAVRRNRTDLVFTANEAPSYLSIFLHHEMAQTPIYPSKLFFFCERESDLGGATPICRSDALLLHLRRQLPKFIEACEKKGVRYSQVMPSADNLSSGQGRSWRNTLNVKNVGDAEAKLSKLDYKWQWQSDGALCVTTPVLPAVKLLSDGREVFFNQLIAAFRGWQNNPALNRKLISFGDDSVIRDDDMTIVSEIADDLSFDISWRTGDVAVLDNFLVMHGRHPFEGERSILASLVA